VAIARNTTTLQEFLRRPEEWPPLELFEGTVTQKMAPSGDHCGVETHFAMWINQFAIPRKLAHALVEYRLNVAGTSLVPDISVYRWDRVPSDERGDLAHHAYLTPDIAIEIVSVGQAIDDLVDRCRWFVENGSSIALLINPRARWVRVFRPGGVELGPLRGADRIDLDDVLPGFELTVDGLFLALRARPE
jgi:Uma2 family endonuclease